ncbi:uncharacterized protein LOC131843556 [Achroia grisella]|uniref:uncharacterized protein LOC131843556 n=1 Tax=Achroia grisella TaxID=688607 RepID=UPI0027D204BC|nr:uncharacterized protein LOC131843556 [Achroia grisella]
MWRLILFSAVLAVAYGQTTPVSQCTSNAGVLPINTYIEDCYDPPCLLPQLEYVVIHIAFRAPRTMRSMRTLATAYLSVIGGIAIPVPYDLQENAVTCNFLTNTYCPVLESEVVLYTLHMFIESFMPVDTSAAIEFRVVDQSDNTPVFCLRTNIRVTPPLGKAIASSNNSTVN